MTSSCFVKNCSSGLQTFTVGNDPGSICQWVEALPTRERPFNPELDVVCAAHFAPGCLQKKQVYILSGGELKVDESRSKIVLQPGAVPTIFDFCVEDDVKEEFVEGSSEVNDGEVNNEVVSSSGGDQPVRDSGLHVDDNEVRQRSLPPPQSQHPSQTETEVEDDASVPEVKLEEESQDAFQKKSGTQPEQSPEQCIPSEDVLPSQFLPAHSAPVPEQETEKSNSTSGSAELTVDTSSNPQPPRRGRPPKLFPQIPLIRVKSFAELREPEIEDEDPENDNKNGRNKPGDVRHERVLSPSPPILVRAVTGSSGQPSPALSIDAPPVLIPEGVRKEHLNIPVAISTRIKRVGSKILLNKTLNVGRKSVTYQAHPETTSKEADDQLHEKPRGRGRPRKTRLLILRKKLPRKVPAVTLVLQTTPAAAGSSSTHATRRSVGKLTKVPPSGQTVPALSRTPRKSGLSLRNYAEDVPISVKSPSTFAGNNSSRTPDPMSSQISQSTRKSKALPTNSSSQASSLRSNIPTNEATAKIGRAKILARKKPMTAHQVPSKKPLIQPVILLEAVEVPAKLPPNSTLAAKTPVERAKITAQMKASPLKKSAKQHASVPVVSNQVAVVPNQKPQLKRVGRPRKGFRGFFRGLPRRNTPDVPTPSEQSLVSANKSQNGSQKVKNSKVGRPPTRNTSKKKEFKVILQPVILIERLSPEQIANLQQQVRDEARNRLKSNSQTQIDSGPKLAVGNKRKSAGRPPGPLSKRKVVAVEPPNSTGAILSTASNTPESSGREISTRNHQINRKNDKQVSRPVFSVALQQNLQETTSKGRQSKKDSDGPKEKTKSSIEPEKLKLIQSGFSKVPMYTLAERRPSRKKSVKSSEQVEAPATPIADPLDAEKTTKQSSQLSSEKGNASEITSGKKRGRPSKKNVEITSAQKKNVEIRSTQKKNIEDDKLLDHPHSTRSKSVSAVDPNIWEPSTEPFVIENDYDSDVVAASPVSDPLDMGGDVENTKSPSDQEEETRMEASYESSPDSKRPAFGEKNTCFVLTCLQKSKKFFHAPRDDPGLFSKWAARIPKRERSLTQRDLICADHFKKEKIRTTVKAPWGKVLSLAEHRWKLLPGAVPTVFRTPRILLQRIQTSHGDYSLTASSTSYEVEEKNIEKCVVPGCGKYRGMKMYEFPFYMTYRKLWVREISRKTGVSIPDKDEFLFGKKVCGHHFLASDYQGGVRSNPLKLSAVPSRFESVGNSDKRSSVSSTSSIRVVVDKKHERGRDSVSSTCHNGPTSENEEIVAVYESLKPTGSGRRKQSFAQPRPGASSSKIASVSPSRRIVRESPGMNATSTESAKQVQQPQSTPDVTMTTQSISSLIFQQSNPVGMNAMAQPTAAMETAYVIDQSSNVVKQLQLIPSAFPSVPMFTVVQSPQQPQRFQFYQTMRTPVTVSAAGTLQQNVQPLGTSATARNYIAQHLAPVWNTDTTKQPISSPLGSTVTSQAGKPTKSTINVKIGQPGKNVSSLPSTSKIEAKTESTSKNKGSPSKQNGSETVIPPNKMKVFKKKENDGRYLISKKDGETIVVPYNGSYDGDIKETFVTPNLGKLVFPSPHEGETIMVVVPSSIPMVGISNSSRSTTNNIKPGPASYKRSKMPFKKETQPANPPSSSEGSKGSGPPMAKRTPKMTASTEFKAEKGQLDRIYDNRRLLKLPNYKTWSIQLLKTVDKKMEKYIFIAETVLKGDEMIRQRMLKIHDTLKFELFVFSNNLTPMFNEKNDLIRSFSALQELLDNFAAFNVCSGVTGFDHIPESSYSEGRRVANCWYSNKCTSICPDTTVCAECTGLLGILSCINLGNGEHVGEEEQQACGFQTEVFFLNPDAAVNFVSPETGNAAEYVSLNDHSDLMATRSAPGDQQGVYYTFDSNNVMGQPMQYEKVMTTVQVPENSCSTTTVPVPSTASAISPPLYVLAPLNL